MASAADMLKWDSERNRVDASIDTWTVPQLLERIAAVTGWKVLMDPGISNTVPTKFRDKTAGDALQRLLGPLNYALAPENNGASRLYVFRNSRDDATQLVAPVPEKADAKKGRIENELVVTLKPGEKIEELAKKLGAKVVGKLDDVNAYRLRFDDANATQTARETLRNDSTVASVEDNYYVAQPEIPQTLGGPGRPLGLSAATVPDSKYVIVALLDTAVQGKDAGIADLLLPEISVAEPCSTPSSSMTHGTAMAATVLRSVAALRGSGSTTIRILPVNVYGCNEMTSTFDVARGVYEAAKAGAKFINASLGSYGDSPVLENAVDTVNKTGVQIYAAAGNEHVATPVYPAAYSSVTAVTAGNKQGEIAPWANYGSFIDVIAPPSSVVNFKDQQMVVTGTSSSTAIASGAAAAKEEQNRSASGNSGSAKKAP